MNIQFLGSGEYVPSQGIPREERPGEKALTVAQPSETDIQKPVVPLDAWGNPMKKGRQPIDAKNDAHFERKNVSTTRPSQYDYRDREAWQDAVTAWKKSKEEAEVTATRNAKKWIDTTTPNPRAMADEIDRPMDDRTHEYADDELGDEDRLHEPNDLPPGVNIVDESDHYDAEKRFRTSEERAGKKGTMAQ